MAFACQGRSDRLRVHCTDAALLGGGYNASVRKASPPFEIQPKSNTYPDWIAPESPTRYLIWEKHIQLISAEL
jgi:hypothetical protein